jgi:hypothetical protein
MFYNNEEDERTLTKLDLQRDSDTFVNDSHLVDFSDIGAFVGLISISILKIQFQNYIKAAAKLENNKASKQLKRKFGNVANMVTYIQEQDDFIKGICLLFYRPFFSNTHN